MAKRPIGNLGEQYFRQLGARGLYVVRNPAHGRTSAHDHLFYELVYIEHGRAQHAGASGTRALRRGDLIVLRPGIWHAYEQPERFGLINCLIEPQLLYRLGRFLDELPGAFDLFRKPAATDEGPVVLRGEAVHPLLCTMIDEQKAQRPGYMAANIARLHEVLVTTTRLYEQQRGDHTMPMAGRADQAVLAAVDYLQRHYYQPITLDELAHHVHLSAAHLSRSFSRRVGLGVIQFVHRLRAEQACRLLCMSNLQIGEIAGKVGYAELAYFSRCFRRQVGMSPRQYQRTHRDQPSAA